MSADAAAAASSDPFPDGSPTAHDLRNDRSERLWGADGQKRLAEAHIVLLGATAAGAEALKNVILPGLGRFTIVDNAKITKQTLGGNFFVGPNSLGGFVAEETVRNLSELNPFAEGHYVTSSTLTDFILAGGDGLLYGDVPAALAHSPDPNAAQRGAKGYKRPPFNATLVIATPRVPLSALAALSDHLSVRHIPLFHLGCNGMLGFMRIVAPDLPVVDTVPGPDNTKFDPRVVHPFPALKEIYEHLNPENKELTDDVFRHLPWPAISYHALKKWRAANGGRMLHCTDKDFFKCRREIVELIKSMSEVRGKDAHGNTPASFDEAVANIALVFSFQTIPSELSRILEQAPSRAGPKSSAFWVFMAALKSFRDEYGYLPLNPKLPDFETTTDVYRALLEAFKAHHKNVEVEELWARSVKILKDKGMSQSDISEKIHKQAIEVISSNAAECQFQHFPRLDDEVGGSHFTRSFTFPAAGAASSVANPDADHMRWHVRNNEGEATGADFAQGWYTALRASWVFQSGQKEGHLRAPGQPASVGAIVNDGSDSKELLAIAAKLWSNASSGGDDAASSSSALPPNVAQQVSELARYGGAEMGHMAAIMGALAGQEAIKFLQHKRVPVTPWVIFDGNTSKFIEIEAAQN